MALGRPAVILVGFFSVGALSALWILAGGSDRGRAAVAPETRRAGSLQESGAALSIPVGSGPESAAPETPSRHADIVESGEAEVASEEASANRPGASRLTGRVIGTDGKGLANLNLRMVGRPRILATTDVAGGFVIEPAAQAETALVRGDRIELSSLTYVAVAQPVVGRAEVPLLLIAAPAIWLSGQVVDEGGQPVPRARLEVDPGTVKLRRFVRLEQAVHWPRFSTRCDGRGYFELTDIPVSEAGLLRAQAVGYLTSSEPMPYRSEADHLIALSRWDAAGAKGGFEGRVIHATGEPAPGARVWFREMETLAGDNGEFRLPAISPAPTDERRSLPNYPRPGDGLVAILAGYEPAVLRNFGAVLGSGSREPVILVLGSASASLAGRLLPWTPGDSENADRKAWRVSLLDGALLEQGLQGPIRAEDLADGASAERRLSDEGEFRFEGLRAEGSYRVRAWNKRTLENVTSEPVPSGTLDVVLQRSNEPPRPLVDGVVFDRAGIPMEGVQVSLSMAEHRVEGSSWGHTAQRMVTGPGGRFSFVEVPHSEDIRLKFTGELCTGGEVPLEPGSEGRNLEVVLGRKGRFAIQFSEVIAGDELVVVGEGDGPIPFKVQLGPGRTSGAERWALEPDRMLEVIVDEDGRWAKHMRGERELRRFPLLPLAGETVSVGDL